MSRPLLTVHNTCRHCGKPIRRLISWHVGATDWEHTGAGRRLCAGLTAFAEPDPKETL